MTARATIMSLATTAVCIGLCAVVAPGNGGPFVVKYPQGDPAAKGVLARLEPDLRPGQITDLRVIKEDLGIAIGGPEMDFGGSRTPLARVSAAYTIENPTDKEVTIDFGFPILRGIYMSPLAMMPMPEVSVRIGDAHVRPRIISNSAIYGIIRAAARKVIDQQIAADAKLAALVSACKPAVNQQRAADISPAEARAALTRHLTQTLKWNARDTALLVEYAGLEFGPNPIVHPVDAADRWSFMRDLEQQQLIAQNMGLLGAIGEQKATQFFAQLAGCFDPKAAASYEAIFTAWGGDVRERSVDLKTGKVRPREIAVDAAALATPDWTTRGSDPTVYARVDYLNPAVKLTEAQKATCQNILKNLPVVFTFAPMNLLHYQAKFAPRSTVVLTVSYAQHPYKDTADPASYQLAYVVHPASLWKEFGPINLTVTAPKGIDVKASVELQPGKEIPAPAHGVIRFPSMIHTATLTDKTGELFVGIDQAAWGKLTAPPAKNAPAK